jgi:hypothetical protein
VRDIEEISLSARPGRAFSNSSTFEHWAFRWCDQCQNDINEDCPLIMVAMFGDSTPTEWVDSDGGYYDCTEFEPREGAS